MPIVLAYVIYRLGGLPGAIARARNHPQADAINVCGWMGIITLVLWPVALAWIYTEPNSHNMSQWAETRKSPNLFDHLVGAGEKGFRDGQRIAFVEIDDEFELGRLPYRKWGGLHRRFKSRINTPRLQLVQLDASRRMSFTHCRGASA